jgi:UDP-N-acetylglucosamine diphosphorylase / glucose-1-phosphate thymidylyltransferase / UDP-N-acetylgalactosamine diphosphorylase / glucosamine-1-phosphate N-acetyltransferase / galactosamine-1-phosphate N-acetyltransferase
MIRIDDHIKNTHPFNFADQQPWQISANVREIIETEIQRLGSDYTIDGNVAIHKSATIEQGVILKGPIIISEDCFVGAHAYLRGGVFLSSKVSVGPGCEIKSSFVFSNSSLAHFNFVGDSILGSQVNMEAGSIIANHYNELEEKEISVLIKGQVIKTGSTKFGGLIGDNVKIGANAVLSPGTLLDPNAIVNRLELIRQISQIRNF